MIVLDVGTRSIICMECDGQTVTRVMRKEHSGPFMSEGAISDMEEVVAGIRSVREAMKLPIGQGAVVAIAGASLETACHRIHLAGTGPFTAKEMDDAEKTFRERSDLVGSSRSGFSLDGVSVRSLIGMEGKRAEYDLFLTFLPIERVRQKLTAIFRGGFNPVRLTIEPLAIAKAVFASDIPPGIWCIVDIGAGTSDIALLSVEGVLGVSSVPAAGDRITRAISAALGLSYLDADSVKQNSDAPVKDVWGVSKTISRDEVVDAAKPAVEEVVLAISSEISRLLAGRTLSGLVLVGGGSLWTDLAPALAAALKIHPAKVGVRGAETIPSVVDKTGMLLGPAYVTPIGIMRNDGQPVVVIDINGRLAVFLGRESISVADAIAASGLDPLDYFGDPGEAFVEGDGRIVGGTPGGEPRITVSGRAGELTEMIGPGSAITLEKGEPGTAARKPVPPVVEEAPVKIAEVVETPAREGEGDSKGFMTIDGHKVYCGEMFRHEKAPDGTEIRLENEPPILSAIVNLPVKRAIRIFLNGEEKHLKDRTQTAVVNGRRAGRNAPVPWNSVIDSSKPRWFLFEVLASAPPSIIARPLLNDQPADFLSEIHDGDRITL